MYGIAIFLSNGFAMPNFDAQFRSLSCVYLKVNLCHKSQESSSVEVSRKYGDKYKCK
jgi:hypothetical protein